MNSTVYKNSRPNCTDVIIAGAGLIGMSLAARLGKAGLSVIVIERNPPFKPDAVRPDLRTTAVAAGSQHFLAQIGAWNECAKDSGIIQEIRVSDGESRRFLHFGDGDMAFGHSAAAEAHPVMGYIVRNELLRRDLHAALAKYDGIKLIQPAEIAQINQNESHVTIKLGDGQVFQASLLIGTEGRNSPVRELVGIASYHKNYGQTALVTVIRHQHPHHNIAHERFLTAGPLAFLPMHAPHESSIVWTTSEAMAPELLRLTDAERSDELHAQFGDWLGKLQPIEPIQSWPLSLHFAYEIARGRVALAGDAAHLIHPIAGQGANLGWRDAADLAELIIKARRVGLDAGQPVLSGQYQRNRMLENLLFAAATDGFNRLFSTDQKLVQMTRRFGLSLVNQLPRLKSAFIRPARLGL